jgi:hypothetical protein
MGWKETRKEEREVPEATFLLLRIEFASVLFTSLYKRRHNL